MAARIVAGVLFMIFAMGTLLGVGACVALFKYNAFNDDGAELFNETADYLMDFGDVSELQHLFESNWSYWGDSQVKDKYLTSNLMANHTNFRFRVCNEAGEELISNYSDQHLVAVRDMDWALNCAIDGEQQVIHERYASLEEANQAARDHYEQLKANDYWYTVDREDEGPWLLTVRYTPREYHTVHAVYGIDAALPVLDRYSVGLTLVNTLIACRNWAVPLTAICLLMTVAAFIFLLVSAGHRTGTAEVSRNWFDRIPLELVLLGMALLVGFGGRALTDRTLTVLGLFLPMLLALGLLFSMTFAVRCKTKTLVKGTLLYWVCRGAWAGAKGLWYMVKNLPLVWKTALVWGGISFVELVACLSERAEASLVVWFIEKLVLTPVILMFAIGLKKLQDGARRMAAGDMAPVPEKFLFPDERKHAQSLNSIGQGGADHQREPRPQNAPHVHHLLRGPAEEGGACFRARAGVCGRAGSSEPAIEETDGGSGGGQQGVHREHPDPPGGRGREPAPLPGGGGVRGAAGRGGADPRDHPGPRGAPYPGRRAAPVAGVR